MHVTWDVQFHENAPYFSPSLQGERVRDIFEDSTPSILHVSPPSVLHVLPVPSISYDQTVCSDILHILSIPPGQITEDSPSIVLKPELDQDSTSSQSIPKAEETPDVHNEVNSSPLVTPNIDH